MRSSRDSRHSGTFKRYANGVPAIGWALLSQSIWLPLLAIDAHDRWQSRVRELKPEVASLEVPSEASLTKSLGADRRRLAAGPLLASSQRDRDPLIDLGVSRSIEVSPASRSKPPQASQPSPAISGSRGRLPAPSASRRPLTISTSLASSSQPRRSSSDQGGVTTSRSRQSIPSLSLPTGASILALAKRSVASTLEDPLAPLPSAWREPMRRALQQLPIAKKGAPSVQPARVIYVPSERLTAPATVPLAIQPDGSLDIFSRPADPLVLEELRNWSNHQPRATKSVISPVVIHLTPIPKATTAMISTPSSAATALRTASPSLRPSTSSPAPRSRSLSSAPTSRAEFLTPPPPLPPLPGEQAAKPSLPSVEATAAPSKVSLNRSDSTASESAQPRDIPMAATSAPVPTAAPAPEPAPAVSAAPAPAAPASEAPASPVPASPAPTPAP